MEAVVSASHGSLGALLGKLNALLADECTRLKGVRREIRFLRSELSNMHAVLHKYTTLEDPGVQVKAWISEVRELAYDVEDCIDKFIHQLGDDHGGIKEFFRRSARRLKTLGSRHRIANQIEELKARVIAVKDQRRSYMLDDIASGHAAVDPRLSALFTEEARLVGIEGPRDYLAKWLAEEESGPTKHRKVLCIVGFGGLGKTTLANEVCRKIGGQFHSYAFLSVSQKPDVKNILKDVIRDVIRQLHYKDGSIEDIDKWEEKKLIAKLRELLQDKRYLVVIDDVWSMSAWDIIKCAFPENNCSSRIIATTRIFDVASSCCLGGDDLIYEMEPLNDLHSKKLFFKRIFGSEDCCPDILKEVSNEILKKCGGLPLAIISISGLLANKPAIKEEWEKIKRSIGFSLDNNRSLEGMKSILSLSYSDLPHNLKTCLLYLSIFPEDYIIERNMLVRLWIAEGFISQERGQNSQEVAESYFYELINKSMIQPVEIAYDGKARGCRVHDIMLELIISKATEENFITLLACQTVIPNPHGSIRRLSIQHTDQQLADVLANTDLRHARSLTCFHSIKWMPRLVQFEALRALVFECCEGLEGCDLERIGKLFQLRYLSFRGTRISKLPPEIVKLQHLETLDLRNTDVEELPPGIFKLTKLLHLLTARHDDHGPTKIPNGIGSMRNLQVLTGLNISLSSASAVEELGSLTSLKELGVQLDGALPDDHERQEKLLSSLCKLGSCTLQTLWIRTTNCRSLVFLDPWSPLPCSLKRFEMITDYYFPEIPKWIVPELTSLVHLDINLNEVTEENLRILGELPALLFLELWLSPDPNERISIPGIGFPRLKEFILIVNTSNARANGLYRCGGYLTFDTGAMPELEKSRTPFLVTVAKPYGFYLGIQNLPCLKEAAVELWVGDSDSDNDRAEVAIRNEANAHPNHPRVIIYRLNRAEFMEENRQVPAVDAEVTSKEEMATGMD